MAMQKTTVDGKTLNQRTADLLDMWQFNTLTDFYVVQGSYNSGVSQSAGTHDGGGALDISTANLGDIKHKKWVVKQGRLACFMAYLRPTISGLWNEHIHAGALGDQEASSGLENQFGEYRNGEDALAGYSPDPDPRIHPITVWPNRPLKKVSLFTIYRQFTTKNPKPKMAVKRVQWVLNEKLGSTLPVDGVAGPRTREAYKEWEKKVKAPAADGVPGKFSLSKLGHGRFNVKFLAYEKWRKTQHNSKAFAAQAEKNNPTFPKK